MEVIWFRVIFGLKLWQSACWTSMYLLIETICKKLVSVMSTWPQPSAC